ncbi:Flp pilus assembly protein CpaB [Agarilytica rhodophyticola]|uniref:Flp pilus assembly protein CpaB n=1 Tax=Agarilytica rhodophyticola TaxID=1737490 RepID=UPI000B341804|nr:Flp pilus assembly protein CpaB [Agarilytica rhodophyticola]
MKKYRSLGLLVVAIVFSGLAGFASVKYLEHREQALIAEFDEKANYTEVIVPNKDLLVGDLISLDTVSVRPVPATYLSNGTLFPNDFDSIVGLTLKEPAGAGKPLLRSQLDGLTGVEKFSQLLSPGQRALTLSIDELQSNENMLMPGDYVDILVKITSDSGAKTVNVTSLLDKVLVLATGITTVADPSYYQAQAAQQGYGSVTVGVASKDVSTLLSAQTLGELIFLLRNPEDESKGRFADGSGLFNNSKDNRIRVFSKSNATSGVLTGSYRVSGSGQKNLWGNAQDTGRLYKKYQGKAPEEKEIKIGQR